MTSMTILVNYTVHLTLIFPFHNFLIYNKSQKLSKKIGTFGPLVYVKKLTKHGNMGSKCTGLIQQKWYIDYRTYFEKKFSQNVCKNIFPPFICIFCQKTVSEMCWVHGGYRVKLFAFSAYTIITNLHSTEKTLLTCTWQIFSHPNTI